MSRETVNAVALKVCVLEEDGAIGDVDGVGGDSDVGCVSDVTRRASAGVRVAAATEIGEGGGRDIDADQSRQGGGGSDEVVRKLRDRLERYRRHRARRAGWVRRFVPTGLWPLDERLPHGGLPCGAITEIYADFAGVGSMTLALRMAGGRDEGTEGRREVGWAPPTGVGRDRGIEGSRRSDEATKRRSDAGGNVETSKNRNVEMVRDGGGRRGPIVVIDTDGDFYPPAVVPLGIALDRMIVLRVRNEKDAFWAAEQSLRCSAVAAVIAPLERIDERNSRRLQLAAETSGCVGIVLRPMHRRTKSFAAVQMLIEGSDEATRRRSDEGGVGPAVRTGLHVDRSTASGFRAFEGGALRLRDGYCCRVTLLAVREGMPTSPCWVDLYHETGTCDVRSLPVDRPVARTG